MSESMKYSADFLKAVAVGRPPNIQRLFPNSKALLVSGKVIDRAVTKKGKAVTIAANGRSNFVIRGVLRAAQKANAAILIEIAKSEGNYCATNFWNMARQVDAACNEMGITVPVAIHADHYTIKGDHDVEAARTEIPSMFEAGVTSIAIDASHMSDDKNLLANIELSKCIPDWAGYETEIGEIKGTQGLSTSEEALFLIEGLNAYDISPDWIALNNGTTHGIELNDAGIQIDLTSEIHKSLALYEISGAQHGTSGNSYERLRDIASKTSTTKANVATALQMISWGLKVNEYGNAILDGDGQFIKLDDEGMTEEMWNEITAYAHNKGYASGNYKWLNLPFESRLMGQPAEIRERMIRRVEDFVYSLVVDVFNAKDTADFAIQEILVNNSYDMGKKCEKVNDSADWTKEKIQEKAVIIDSDKGPDGDFDD